MRIARRSSLLAFGLSLVCTFTTASAVDLDPATHWLVIGDFNGDGLMDALYQPMDTSSEGGILLQDSSGNLSILAQGWEPGYLGLDWSSADTTLNAADLNGDGKADIIAQPNQPGGNASVLFMDPTVQLLQIGQVIPPNYLGFDWSASTHTVVAGDFDGDGRAELFMQAVNPGDSGYVVHTDVNGQLSAITQTIVDGYLGRTWNATSVTLYVGDFNGDGRQDLLIQVNAGVSLAESSYALLLADANGQFTSIAQTWNQSDLGGDWNPSTHQVVIEDANGDGIMDITLRSIDPNGTNYVFLGNTQGVFTQPATTWVGTQSASAALNPPQNGGGGGGGSGGSGSGTTTRSIGFGGDNLSSENSVGAPPLAPTEPSPPHPGAPGSGSNTGSSSIQSTVLPGALQGKGGVSGGTATYSIPIAIPPGIAGMQPSVSLSYSSRGGNGEMGMGWSLSAGSQIHRCPATQAMDGYSVGVTYGPTDRLCLDGQHLVLVSGSYGYDQAVYHTELDGFDLVTENGNIGGSGSTGTSFTVQQKDGHVSTYGGTANSVFVASGASNPLAWGISKELDTHQNNITYTYSTFGLGEYLLTQILYTGYNTTTGDREVDFKYSPRPDVTSQYLAGGITTQTQLLQSVYSYAQGTLGVIYDLEYAVSSATNRSTLAGVQECAGPANNRSCFPETTFTWHSPATSFAMPLNLDQDMDESEPAFSSIQANQPTISSPGDLDGDGRKELMYYRPGKYTLVYFMNADGSVKAKGDISGLFDDVMPFTYADINNQGADVMLGEMHGTNSLGYATFMGFSGNTPNFSPVHDLGIQYGQYMQGVWQRQIVAVKDMDGDGKPDILSYSWDSGAQTYNLQLRTNITPAGSSTPQFSAPVTIYSSPGSNSFSVDGDLDGNGLPDITVYAGTQLAGYLMAYRDVTTHAVTYAANNTLALGINNLAVDTRVFHLSMDINGDGLKDVVFDCWNSAAQTNDLCYQLNTGSPGASMFGPVVDTGSPDPLDLNMQSGAIQADLDNDGVDELVYPYEVLADYCIYEHGVKTGDGKVSIESCAYQGDYGITLAPSDDYSIYSYHRMKFLPVVDPTQPSGYRYEPLASATGPGLGLVGQSHLAQAIDLQGDGLTGLISPFTNWYQLGHFKNVVSSYQHISGPSVASNNSSSSTSQNAAPDLMLSAKNGLGLISTWTYYPLSSPQTFNSVPLYWAPSVTDSSRYSNSDYFYFASSMYVVGSYTLGNGSHSYTNDDFHYAQAIYNNQGRGFQGFRTVVDDDVKSGSRTVEIYHQRFPLSGELQESWVTPQSATFDLTNPTVDSNAIEHVVDSWGCMIGTGTSLNVDGISCDPKLGANTFVPVLADSVETHFDLNSHDLLSTTHTMSCPVSGTACNGPKPTDNSAQLSEGYDAFGNQLGSVSIITDPYGTYTSSASNSYTSNATTWWLDRLDSKTTDVQAAYIGVSPSAPVSRTTTYTGYVERLPGTVTAMSGTALNIQTVYGYTRGNVTDVTVSQPGNNLLAPRHVGTLYDSENYFPIQVTDPLGHVTTMVSEPLFGEVTSATDPNQILTTVAYDVFGRKISAITSATGQTAIEQDVTYNPPGGNCPTGDNTGTDQYYVMVTQDGAPTHYTCYDELNRVMRTASESISDTIFVDTVYDGRGRVIQTSEPYFASSGTPQWNVDSFDTDILGRMNQHVTAGLVTSKYVYTDLTTNIATSSATDPERDDAEVKNSLGKLMTVTNVTNDSSETAQVQYGYDSDGNPSSITTYEGPGVGSPSSTILATYDPLGHKTQVIDPDQGTSNFTYDVFGDLLTQQDAKQQVQTMTYDPEGRMLTKSSSIGGEPAVSWHYDSCAIHKLCSVVQGDGTVYQESYGYDSFSRVTLARQTINQASYDTTTAYDAAGHVDSVAYPSSVVDAAPVVSASVGGSSPPYVAPGSTVTLIGSATDPDGGPQPLNYQWAQTNGNAVTLSSSVTLSPTFTAPAATNSNKSYTFSLTADDGLLATTASVTATVPALPTINNLLTDGDTDHDGAYNVTWGSNSPPGPAPTYYLQQASGTDGTTVPAQSAFSTITSGTNLASYPVSHPGNGSNYYWYQVYGTDLSGQGSTSTPVSIHVVVKPGAPASISPSGGTSHIGVVYTVSWGAYTGSLQASKVFYELYEATSSNFAGQTLAYTGTGLSQGISKGTGQNGTYYYRVRACNQSDGLEVCSGYTGSSVFAVTGGGGGGGGGGCPPPPEQCQLVMDDGLAVLTPLDVSMPQPSQPVIMDRRADPARPRFAPPIYQAWADARIQAASGGGTSAQLKVKYHYDSTTGYLTSLTDSVNPNRIFWSLGSTNALNARGQVLNETYGPDAGSATVIQASHTYDDATGFETGVSATEGGFTVQNMQYYWTAAGNLQSRTASVPVTTGGTTTYVSLSEAFTYDLHNRLKTAQVSNANGPQPMVTYAYSPGGNINCKSDVVGHDCSANPTGYTYAENGAGPHALTHIGSAAYSYDLDGNMTSRNGTTVAWNSDNLPTSFDQHDGNSSTFSYAPDKHRFMQVANYSGSQETTLYLGGLEVVQTGTGVNAVNNFRHTLTAYGKPIVMATYNINGSSHPTLQAKYILEDQIGSFSTFVDTVTGTPLPQQAFDAFGARRSATDWHSADTSENAPGIASHRGFTGHEHLDNIGLIHMNGRVYDPTVGRFLSVDPVFQAPTNSQSVNPYSYVMNNPLSLVDPSGYESAPACANGSSTACPNEITHGDAMTGTHIHGVNSGIKGADLKDLKLAQVGRLLIKMGDTIKQFSSAFGPALTAALSGMKDALHNAYFGNGKDPGQTTSDTLKKPTTASDIGKPANDGTIPVTDSNVRDLAQIMMSESSTSTTTEQQTVGDVVINVMKENGYKNVADIFEHKKTSSAFAHNQDPTKAMLVLARAVLTTLPDITNGGDHFYTPALMPAAGEEAWAKENHIDIKGGLEQVPGLDVQTYRPGWANDPKHFTERVINGVDPADFKVYGPPTP